MAGAVTEVRLIARYFGEAVPKVQALARVAVASKGEGWLQKFNEKVVEQPNIHEVLLSGPRLPRPEELFEKRRKQNY